MLGTSAASCGMWEESEPGGMGCRAPRLGAAGFLGSSAPGRGTVLGQDQSLLCRLCSAVHISCCSLLKPRSVVRAGHCLHGDMGGSALGGYWEPCWLGHHKALILGPDQCGCYLFICFVYVCLCNEQSRPGSPSHISPGQMGTDSSSGCRSVCLSRQSDTNHSQGRGEVKGRRM